MKLAFFLMAVAASAQPSPRSFEVASIQVRQGRGRIGVTTSGNRLTATACRIPVLIFYAYDIKSYQLADAPALAAVGDTFYDVAAKADGESIPSVAEFRAMLRQLLADRFKLKLHREQREVPVYELVVAKGGPKLKGSAADVGPAPRYSEHGRNWEMILPRASVADLVNELLRSGFLDRPVLDKTGLAGTYNINLTYTPDTPPNKREPDPNDLSIFTALQEQLGLKLEPRKGTIETLVVDHVEKPTEN